MPKIEKAITPEQMRFENAVLMFMTNGACADADKAGTVLRAHVRKASEYLCRQENKLRRLAEDRCNGCRAEWERVQNARIREDREATVRSYVARNIGCPCSFQDDPRGLQIRLHLKCPETNNFFNTMDGETSGTGWIYAED